MADAMDRDFARSQAFLIGTWNYGHLKPVPAAEHSLTRMYTLLTGPLGGWPPDRVHLERNPKTSSNLADLLTRKLRSATDVALFYYVGHGQIGYHDELCLALEDSESERDFRIITSLTFQAVRHAFYVTDATTKIAILDCCYSGLAAGVKPLSAQAIDHIQVPGCYVLTACPAYETAWFDNESEGPQAQTYFTKYLLDSMDAGIPDTRPGLALEDVFRIAQANLASDKKPVPDRLTHGGAGRYLIARNPAQTTAGQIPPPSTPDDMTTEAPRHDSTVQRTRVQITRPIATDLRHRWKRVLAVTAAAVVLAVAAAGGIRAANPGHSAAPPMPGCGDIGKFMTGLDEFRWNRQTWIDAYNAAGGRAVLGCPVPIYEQGFVHQWGQGLSQDITDQNRRQARLMAIDPDHVIVMTGTYWTDYTEPNERLAAGRQGYPTSDPLPCGDAKIVELAKGDYTPGAMVTSPDGHFQWLPRAVWTRYQQLGGVEGPLGRPLNSLNSTMTGVIQFEYGRITVAGEDARATLDNPATPSIPATNLCPQ